MIEAITTALAALSADEDGRPLPDTAPIPASATVARIRAIEAEVGRLKILLDAVVERNVALETNAKAQDDRIAKLSRVHKQLPDATIWVDTLIAGRVALLGRGFVRAVIRRNFVSDDGVIPMPPAIGDGERVAVLIDSVGNIVVRSEVDFDSRFLLESYRGASHA